MTTRGAVNALATEKALAFKRRLRGADLANLVAADERGRDMLKNVCAKVTPDLAEEIDQVCDLLDVNKREFLEAAFIDAVGRAKAIFEGEGCFEAMDDARQATPISGVQVVDGCREVAA
jgi:alkylhydroperoxidase family enzyme